MTIDAVYATCKSVTVTKKGVHVVLNAENGNFPSDVTRFAGEIVKLVADDRQHDIEQAAQRRRAFHIKKAEAAFQIGRAHV